MLMREKKPCVGGGGFFRIDRPGVGIVTADEEGVLVLGENGDGDVAPSFFDSIKAAGAQVPRTKSRHKKTRVALLVREKVRRVLEDATGLADSRSGKLEENDFLRLLHAFNEEGIHFS